MNDIKDAVFNYLKMDSGGALLITGYWGVGKTFYIRNTLFGEIKNSKKSNYKPIIVSLYGENDTSKISTKIIQSLISNNIISAKKITSGLADIVKSFPIIRKYFDPEEFVNLVGGGIFELLKKNNILLFFDDLERLGKDLSINDFLGYVNDLTENQKCKVIIVANEGEIKDEFTYKEKTISKTVVFSIETENAFASLTNTYDSTSDFQNFLKDNQDFFLKTLRPKVTNPESELSERFKAEIKKDFANIRSLKAALDHFKEVFQLISKDEDISDEIFKQKLNNVWCFCLATTVETRKSEGLKLNQKKGIDSEGFNLAFLFDEKEKKTDDDLTFSEIFSKKYFERIGEDYHYYSNLFDFIVAGKRFKKEILNDELNKYYKTEDNKLSPHYSIYQDFMSLKRSLISDQEFPEKLELLLKHTEKGNYNDYSEYINIAIFLFGFKDYFKAPKRREEIDEKVRNGIRTVSKYKEYSYQWEITREHFSDEVKDEDVIRIIQFIDDIVAAKKRAQVNVEAAQWQEMLLRSPKEFRIEIIEKNYQGILTKNDPFFSYFNPESIIEKIPFWQAEDIMMFSSILEKRYLRNYIDPLRNEFENVERIVNYIIGYDLTEKKYSNYYIEKTLLPTARQVKTKIEKTIKSLEQR